MSNCEHPTLRSGDTFDQLRVVEPCLFCERNRLAAENAALRKDAERLDWLERHLFEGKWDGTIGRPKSWHMAGPYRHTLKTMHGDTLRKAIDAAMEGSHE